MAGNSLYRYKIDPPGPGRICGHYFINFMSVIKSVHPYWKQKKTCHSTKEGTWWVTKFTRFLFLSFFSWSCNNFFCTTRPRRPNSWSLLSHIVSVRPYASGKNKNALTAKNKTLDNAKWGLVGHSRLVWFLSVMMNYQMEISRFSTHFISAVISVFCLITILKTFHTERTK